VNEHDVSIQDIQKGMKQFEMGATMEQVWKVKGGTTGCENAGNLQPSKQHALCKVAYIVEKCCRFVTVQRLFHRKCNR
jgi:hypothetical protein